jgi:predicted membrane protein
MEIFWEYLIYPFIVFGLLILIGLILLTIGMILDKFFPKRKFSKITEKILDWIEENISLNF